MSDEPVDDMIERNAYERGFKEGQCLMQYRAAKACRDYAKKSQDSFCARSGKDCAALIDNLEPEEMP